MTKGEDTGWNYFWEKVQGQRSFVITVCVAEEEEGRRWRPYARAEPDTVHRRSRQVDKLIVRKNLHSLLLSLSLQICIFFYFSVLVCTLVSYFQSTASPMSPRMKRKHLYPLLSHRVKQECAVDTARLSNAFVKVSFLLQMNRKLNICITFAPFSLFQGPTIDLEKKNGSH